MVNYENDKKFIQEELSENLLRRKNLAEGIRQELKDINVSINEENRNVTIYFNERLVCGICVEDEYYRIFDVSSEWANIRKCYCKELKDETWFYYLDTMDECIGEVQCLVNFEVTNLFGNNNDKGKNTSELRKSISAELFEKIYIQFMEQAEQNAISMRSNGSERLDGKNKYTAYGKDLARKFGSGNSSRTPYICWYVVSIYYIFARKRLIIYRIS
jgi:hypothetical protein